MVYFFEKNLIAVNTLIEISAELETPLVSNGERLPNYGSCRSVYPENGLAPRGFCLFGDFIIRVVGEKRVFSVSSARAQASIAGDKHPMVAITDDTHEERTHFVTIRQLKIAFAGKFYLLNVWHVFSLVAAVPQNVVWGGKRIDVGFLQAISAPALRRKIIGAAKRRCRDR